MPDLAGRGPIGQKPPKTPNKPRRSIPRKSAKRKDYLASPARADGVAHMARVARLPCLVCKCWPVEVHHATKPRDDMQVLPLCVRHHKREYGPGAIHYSPKAFAAEHGTVEELLARVEIMLARGDDVS